MNDTLSRRGFFRDVASATATAVGLTVALTACKGEEAAAPKPAPKPPEPKPAPKPPEPAAPAEGQAAAGGEGCTDVSSLTANEKQLRQTLGYVDVSPNPEKHCTNCQLFVAPTADAKCGGCTVVKGPINPVGYCNSWVAKA